MRGAAKDALWVMMPRSWLEADPIPRMWSAISGSSCPSSSAKLQQGRDSSGQAVVRAGRLSLASDGTSSEAIQTQERDGCAPRQRNDAVQRRPQLFPSREREGSEETTSGQNGERSAGPDRWGQVKASLKVIRSGK